LGGASHGEGRIARRRIAGARVQGLLGCATGYSSRSRRESERRRSSPRVRDGRVAAQRDVGGEVDPRVAAALEGEAAAVELRRLDPAN